MAPTSRKFRRVRNSLLVFTVLALSVVSASGSSILIDADTLTGDSLVSTGSWNSSDWSISYQISRDTNSQVWTYDYTISLPEKIRNNGSRSGQPLNDLKYFIVEVDTSFSPGDILSSSTSGSSNSTLMGPTTWSTLIGDIYGYQWDKVWNQQLVHDFTLTTPADPMPGTFLAVDGVNQNQGALVYATGSVHVPGSYTAGGGINPLPTPEPASILLLGSGLLGLALARRRYAKKRTRV